uniref:Phosphorylated adapter RNA export protein n=1 Tax=Gongylonema pulchrum TaxID=637853 RepID=A0A183E9N6_9BILA
LELFDETREIEVTGGMMVADGTRRRTPGGVFMTLFKTDPDVLPVLKDAAATAAAEKLPEGAEVMLKGIDDETADMNDVPMDEG